MKKSGSITDLRDELAGIASTAIDLSDSALATLAGTMFDLLGIAQTVNADAKDTEAESDGPTEAILEYCEETVLPMLRSGFDNQCDAQQVELILQDIEQNWGDYLGLLNANERFGHKDPAWRDEVYAWDQFNRDASADSEIVPTDSPTADDIATLLSSLNGLTDKDDSGPATEFPTSLPVLVEQPPSSQPLTIDPELMAAYMDDARQCLSGMEASLLSFESGGHSAEAMRQFCRELHTLKGASGTVELYELATWLHDLETHIESTDPLTLDVDALLSAVDVVREQLAGLTPETKSDLPALNAADFSRCQPTTTVAQSAVTIPNATATQQSDIAGSTSTSDNSVRLEAARLDRLMDLLAELVMLRNRRDTYVVGLRNLRHELNGCAHRIRTFDRDSLVEGEATDCDERPGKTRYTARSLAEVSNDVNELSRSLETISEPLSQDNALVSHLVGRFRQELMELRRQPIAGLFQRVQRAARNVGRTENKSVEVEFIGPGTRVERAMQERLYEPLMHMVRNSVSHGIESAAVRAAAGKPESGRITLEAWSDGSTLFLELRDDGRGLDKEALQRRGRELGLLPVGDVTEEQLYRLIFHAGFSTKSGVSEISGRGIGMDVVDSWIRRLRGRINVSSTAGQGTTFRLQIPLRSAIEHAMIVRVGGQLFALPMQACSGTEADNTSESADRVVPLNTLLDTSSRPEPDRRILSLRDSAVRTGPSPSNQSTNTPDTVHTREIRIAVDAVVGVEEVVVRSLPPMLARHDLFAGVTLSGQAETVLLLDVSRLIDIGRQFSEHPTNDLQTGGNNATKAPKPHSPRILIVDDSVTVRRSLARRLGLHGLCTSEVPDGAEAMDALRTGDFDAVVSDIDMPRMNGLELLTAIRCNSRLQSLPVVVITSRDDAHTLLQLKELQATAVLNKPVTDDTVSDLLQAIAHTCQ